VSVVSKGDGLNIKIRLVSSIFLIFLIAVGMLAATWVVTTSQKDDSLVINLAGRQRMLSQKLAKEVLAFQLTKDEKVEKQIDATMAVFEKTLSALADSGQAPLTLNPEGPQASLPSASATVATKLAEVRSLWSRYRKLIESSLSSGVFSPAEISKQSVLVLKNMNAAVVMMQQESEKRVVTLLITQGVFVVIGIVILIGVLRALNNNLTAPLHNLKGFASRVADGDLDAKVEGNYIEELLELKNALEAMVANLKKGMADLESKGAEAQKNADGAREAMAESETRQQQIQGLLGTLSDTAMRARDISQNVARYVSELASQVDEANRGTEVQRDRMAETATAMGEMNSTVLEVAHNASSAAEAAGRARENAQTGAEGVRAAVVSIDKIKGQILDLNSSMSELGMQAENIGNIMNVVTDIADQTNLLALNAAIEAARAGEAGRGFAVVADEVRKLAEKTMDATKEVGQAVGTIQEQARNNIRAVETSVEDIVRSNEAASESGSFMGEIVDIVGETAGMVDSIAAASEEQSAASEEINRAVADVTQVANETAEGMALAARSLEEMAAMAEELDTVISEMTAQSAKMS